MSNKSNSYEAAAFDALPGKTSPSVGLGEVIANSQEIQRRFRLEAAEARKRLQAGFNVKLENPSEIPQELDGIIRGMWATGWNPKTGNLNLFTRDIGTVLSVVLLDSVGGQPVFRSETDVSHFSIFLINAKLEVFPFHKVYKCLSRREGERIASFVKGIR